MFESQMDMHRLFSKSALPNPAARRGHCLEWLPDECLRAIAAASVLTFKDRLAFFSCCRATRLCQSQATHLWPDLDFTLEKPQQVARLAAWLAANRSQLVTLTLSIPEPARTPDASDEVARLAQLCMLVVGGLAGGTVHTLCLHLSSAAEVYAGSWLRMLPQLAHLSVKAGKLAVAPDLGDVTLATLRLAHHHHYPTTSILTLPPGCLPRQLQRLDLSAFSADALARALPPGGLPQLHRLSLMGPEPEGWPADSPHWELVASLSSLTSLTLKRWEITRVPQPLSSLTRLRRLSVEGGEFDGAEDPLRPLAAMSLLTKLVLSHNSLRTFPLFIFSLPHLESLDVSNNLISGPLELGCAPLTELKLDEDTAVAWTPALTRLSALRVLHVYEQDWTEGVSAAEVGQLINVLRKMPQFKTLRVDNVDVGPSSFLVARELLTTLGDVIQFDIVL